MLDWSPSQYLKFAEERTRPATELLARVVVDAPRLVTDIGCGPGNSTELLAARWPAAEIQGFDTSPAMIAAAAARLPGRRFFLADTASWRPSDEDVVFANAVFQWVSGHVRVLAEVFAAMKQGAVLAVQMPDNFAAPVHALMRATAAEQRWAGAMAGLTNREGVAPIGAYYDAFSGALAAKAGRLDLWHTHYHHVVEDVGAIVEWMKATGLRPFLERIAEGEQADFLAAYRQRLAAAYPAQSDGRVIFSAPRIFIVAERG